MLIINNIFLSVYDYNFLLYYEKIFSVKQPKDQRFKAEDEFHGCFQAQVQQLLSQPLEGMSF